MASPWLQGMQFGFDSSLRMQELKSQQAIRRIHEENAAKALSLKIQENELAIQERADMAKAVSAAQLASSPKITVPMMGQEDLGDMAPPVMTVDNPNPMTRESAAIQFVLPVVAKYRPDQVPNFLEGVALAEYRNKAETQGDPEIKNITGPDGRQHQVFDPGGKGVRQLVAPAPSITEINGEQFYQSGPNRFTRIPKDIGDRQLRVAATKNALEKAPTLLQLDENGTPYLPKENFQKAMRMGALPSSFKTEMLQKMAATQGVFDVGRLLLPLMKPENVGIPGFINRTLIDNGAAQVFPWMKIGRATDTQSIATNFRSGLVKAMKSDGNVTQKEIDILVEGLPTPDELLSSPQSSKSKIAQQLELAAIQSRAAANILEKPITPFYLTREEIREMVGSDQLTVEEGAQWWNNNAWNLINQIRAEVQR